jgi:hypothetical protein
MWFERLTPEEHPHYFSNEGTCYNKKWAGLGDLVSEEDSCHYWRNGNDYSGAES